MNCAPRRAAHVLVCRCILVIAIWAALIPAAAAGETRPQLPARSTRLELLVVASPTLSGFCDDFIRVRDFFVTGLKAVNKGRNPGEPDYVEFDAPGAPVLISKESNREWFRNLILGNNVVDENTTFVLYYRGHGFTTPDRPKQYLYLDKFDPAYSISREDVIDCLDKRLARLNVLITECCAHTLEASPGFFAALPVVPDFPRLFSNLFVTPSGLVDLTSSLYTYDRETRKTIGQRTWVTPAGGLFTISLVDTLTAQQAFQQFGKNPDATVRWQGAIDAISSRTNDRYHALQAELEANGAGGFVPLDILSMIKDQADQKPVGTFKPK